MTSALSNETDQWTGQSTSNTNFGRSFGIEWFQLADLPFKDTQNLHNPLNGIAKRSKQNQAIYVNAFFLKRRHWFCLHSSLPLADNLPVRIARDCQELPADLGFELCRMIDTVGESQGKPSRIDKLRSLGVSEQASLPKSPPSRPPPEASNGNSSNAFTQDYSHHPQSHHQQHHHPYVRYVCMARDPTLALQHT